MHIAQVQLISPQPRKICNKNSCQHINECPTFPPESDFKELESSDYWPHFNGGVPLLIATSGAANATHAYLLPVKRGGELRVYTCHSPSQDPIIPHSWVLVNFKLYQYFVTSPLPGGGRKSEELLKLFQ